MISNPAAPSPELRDAAPELVRRLAMLIAAVSALVARRFLREPKLMGLTVLLCGWLSRSAQRFGRAMVRTRTVARPARGDRVRAPGVSRTGAVRLPTGRGWLVRALGYEAAGYGSQLTHLLADPDMQAVLARIPALGRILRPLCQMLWIPEMVELGPVIVPPKKIVRAACPPRPVFSALVDAVALPSAGVVCAGFAKSG